MRFLHAVVFQAQRWVEIGRLKLPGVHFLDHENFAANARLCRFVVAHLVGTHL